MGHYLECFKMNNQTMYIRDKEAHDKIDRLSTVATTGSYNDLSDKPQLSTVATTGSYNDLSNKPQLSTVATTGSYNDLSNKPQLSTVATTGNYNDLFNKPIIPDITTQVIYGNSSVTLISGGTTAYTDFTIPSGYTFLGIVGVWTNNGFINVYDFGMASTSIYPRIDMRNGDSVTVTVTPAIVALLKR